MNDCKKDRNCSAHVVPQDHAWIVRANWMIFFSRTRSELDDHVLLYHYAMELVIL
jgi:hypothetical protein